MDIWQCHYEMGLPKECATFAVLRACAKGGCGKKFALQEAKWVNLQLSSQSCPRPHGLPINISAFATSFRAPYMQNILWLSWYFEPTLRSFDANRIISHTCIISHAPNLIWMALKTKHLLSTLDIQHPTHRSSDANRILIHIYLHIHMYTYPNLIWMSLKTKHLHCTLDIPHPHASILWRRQNFDSILRHLHFVDNWPNRVRMLEAASSKLHNFCNVFLKEIFITGQNKESLNHVLSRCTHG